MLLTFPLIFNRWERIERISYKIDKCYKKIYKKLKWINKGIKVILNKNIPKNVL